MLSIFTRDCADCFGSVSYLNSVSGFCSSKTGWWARSPTYDSCFPPESIMKIVWPTVWPGASMACTPGNDLLAILDELHPLAVRFEVLGRRFPEHLELGRHVVFGGPEIVVGLGSGVLVVGEMRGSVARNAAAAWVDVRMAHHHGVDILRVDPSLFHAAQQPAGRRPEQFQAPHAGVEQDELVASVDDECVLLQHHILERQEVVGELLSHFRLCQADEIVLGLAERQRAIGDDGPLEIA